ncbi:MAG: 7-cyano-7-deazaguanine synthase QueC [Candidatus Omnitrophica bacterium]|nr:7-cyano-7-deazaguanine synthase QueC [Candidatus Omnitrophota bacterium]
MNPKTRVTQKTRAVVLLSGGIDSATALYIARRKGYQCDCLTFVYGQRHFREVQCARALARKAGCSIKVLTIALPWKGSSLIDRKIPVPRNTLSGALAQKMIPSTYVPARNTIFLSFALSYAEAIDARAVFIGAHAQDYSGYPDCRIEFFRAFEKVACTGTKAGAGQKRIRIETPLLHLNKSRIISMGRRAGVPFELTWSCYRGGTYPCGSCESCYYRAKGFREAGVKDPLKRGR